MKRCKKRRWKQTVAVILIAMLMVTGCGAGGTLELPDTINK